MRRPLNSSSHAATAEGRYTPFMRSLVLSATLLFSLGASAQWQLQDSHTTADLRGIHGIGNGIAWASGTNGTVLRTVDEGKTWQPCTIPPGADKLDFRGIQAFDADTAIVMSSGKGDLSRLYKTTDACKSWKLVFTNPDAEGFWDAMQFVRSDVLADSCFGVLVGDPVHARFPVFLTYDCGNKWEPQIKEFPVPLPGEGLFAASNSSLILDGTQKRAFVTGGTSGARILQYLMVADDTRGPVDFEAKTLPGQKKFVFMPRHMQADSLPWGHHLDSSGAFAISSRRSDRYVEDVVIVGGDYRSPNEPGYAVTGFLGGSAANWRVATTPPHGYRSSVAYSPMHQTWITVGPNGTDISKDDGRNWQALRPNPQGTPEEDQHWNALSLPFVVGPRGRIGILRPDALK